LGPTPYAIDWPLLVGVGLLLVAAPTLVVALALAAAAGKSERQVERAEVLDALEDVKSPSGRPFFPSPVYRDRLEADLTEMGLPGTLAGMQRVGREG